jgi:hypothetical protein
VLEDVLVDEMTLIPVVLGQGGVVVSYAGPDLALGLVDLKRVMIQVYGPSGAPQYGAA